MPTSPTSPTPTVNVPLAPSTGYTTGVSSTVLQTGYTYTYDGAWDPNTTYHGATDANGAAAAADIVEFAGAFWLSNYISTDQAPTASGQYGPWLQIGGANSTTNTIHGTFINKSGSSVGAPAEGLQAPGFNPNPAVPSVITSLTSMHLTPTSEELFWSTPAVYGAGEVTSYNVYEVVSGTINGHSYSNNILLGTTSANTFIASNLTPSTSHTFMVVASNIVGNSGGFNTITSSNADGFEVTNYNHSISENPVAPGSSQFETRAYTYTDYNGAQQTVTLSFSTLKNATVTTTTLADHGSSGKYVSPYIDVTVPGNDLLHLAQTSGGSTTGGLTNFTLAFMQTDRSEFTPNPSDNATGPFTLNTTNGIPVLPTLSFGGLGGVTPESTGTIAQQVKAIESGGGTVTISFGGYTGLDAAVANRQYYTALQTSAGGGYSAAAAEKMAVANLQTEYQSVINTFGVHHLDFDVEGATTVNDTEANHIRDLALIGLEKANPGLSVSFTLATNANGLSDGTTQSGGIGVTDPTVQNVLGVLQQAATDGVKIDVVNIMAMDYYDGNQQERPDYNPSGTNAMYSNAVTAAQATEAQVQAIASTHNGWSAPLIGITPMIGQNDDVGPNAANGYSSSAVDEVFTLNDATALVAWAAQQPYVAGFGEWELPRDNASSTTNYTEAKQDSSGVVQAQDQFTKTFLQITNAGTLLFNNSTPQTYTQVISGGDDVSVQGTAPLTLTAAETYTGRTLVGGTLLLTGAGSITNTSKVGLQAATSVFDISGASSATETVGGLSGTVAGSQVRIGSHVLAVGTAGVATAFAGSVVDGGASGGTGGSLQIASGSTLTLTGTQGYTGHTTIYGTLLLSGNAGLGSSRNVALKAAGAVFDISGVDRPETILNLNGVAGSHVELGGNALRVNQSTAATYSGVISDGGVVNNTGGGLLIKGTAMLTLAGSNTFTGGITFQGGAVELAAPNAGGASGHAIGFLAGAGATLAIDDAAMTGSSTNHSFATNPIVGFDATDRIDLVNLAYVGDPVTSYNSGTGVLTVVQGSYTDTVSFYGMSSGANFTASSDGHGGTLVQLHG